MLRAAGIRSFQIDSKDKFLSLTDAEKFTWLGDMMTDESAKRELATLKKSYFDVKSAIDAMPKEPVPIDWAALKKEFGNAELVDGFEQAFSGLVYPKYAGTEIAEAEAKFAELGARAQAMAAESEVRCKEIEVELEKVAAQKAKLKTAELDTILAEDPTLREEVDNEIKNDEWY
eukprot:gene1932-2616_t